MGCFCNNCKREINFRIAQAKEAFNNKLGPLTSKPISLKIKNYFIRSIVCSLVIYELETRTLLKEEISRQNAFEMWCLPWALRIPWTRRLTNDKVLKNVEEKRKSLGGGTVGLAIYYGIHYGAGSWLMEKWKVRRNREGQEQSFYCSIHGRAPYFSI